jgi:hypothetical protein
MAKRKSRSGGRMRGLHADMICGFLDWNVSKELEADFAEWIRQFECDSWGHFETFPWQEFHRRGIELSTRLKREIGSAARVRYLKPSEDPNWQVEAIVEIDADSEENTMAD